MRVYPIERNNIFRSRLMYPGNSTATAIAIWCWMILSSVDVDISRQTMVVESVVHTESHHTQSVVVVGAPGKEQQVNGEPVAGWTPPIAHGDDEDDADLHGQGDEADEQWTSLCRLGIDFAIKRRGCQHCTG